MVTTADTKVVAMETAAETAAETEQRASAYVSRKRIWRTPPEPSSFLIVFKAILLIYVIRPMANINRSYRYAITLINIMLFTPLSRRPLSKSP